MRDAQERDWEDLARLDPFWAIVSGHRARGGLDRDLFFASGKALVEKLMMRADALGVPQRRATALDFGCGAGRLCGPLVEHFDDVLGIDISESMIHLARDLHTGVPGCRFRHASDNELLELGEHQFDLVHTRQVLQHLPSPVRILAAAQALAGALAPGGLLVLHVPTGVARRHRLQPQRRIYSGLRAIGVSPSLLYRARLHPIRMTAVKDRELRAVLGQAGLKVIAIDEHRRAGGRSATYWATYEPGVSRE